MVDYITSSALRLEIYFVSIRVETLSILLRSNHAVQWNNFPRGEGILMRNSTMTVNQCEVCALISYHLTFVVCKLLLIKND